jgi:hypothetical protein
MSLWNKKSSGKGRVNHGYDQPQPPRFVPELGKNIPCKQD